MESGNFLPFRRAFALKPAHYNDPLAGFARYIDSPGTTRGVPREEVAAYFEIRNASAAI